MYLSNVKLWNFRKFGSTDLIDLERPNLDLNLKPGLNVLVGENDTGKSSIVDAIRLVLGTYIYDWSRVTEEDFTTGANRLRVELLFADLRDEEAKNFLEWLSWKKNGNAVEPQLRLILDCKKNSVRVLPSEVRAGADTDGSMLHAEARDYLRCTYLKPLRDAQSDLVPKRNSRIAQIFQSHDAFKGKEESHYLVEHFRQLNKTIKEYFHGNDSNGLPLAVDLKGKDLKEEIDRYIRSFRTSDAGTDISVVEANLKAILEKLELSIDGETNPGLGSLNRLCMAAELIHLNKSNWHGLRLALIEELEAHLHPQAQMQIVEELQTQTKIQFLLTTHSPNLTSKSKLESLIICNSNCAFPMGSSYTLLDQGQYHKLELFLDVTKANLFFAKNVILVEGWAEELIIPALANKMKALGLIPKTLTEAGVSVINVAGTNFLEYARIFQRRSDPQMNIRVAVITDSDVPEFVKSADGLYTARDTAVVAARFEEIERAKRARFDTNNTRVFIAPRWTLEYSILQSMTLRDQYLRLLVGVHSQFDVRDPDRQMAIKLISHTLDKTELAFKFAAWLEQDAGRTRQGLPLTCRDCGIGYLMDAIKYATEH